MNDTILSSGRDAFLIAIPFIGVLLACLLRVDELVAAPKPGGVKHRSTICGQDENGQPILCDPDGRPWVETRRRK
jgi:hypothetical protein